ncbi:hypothetical protein [Mariprofundus ferrooxydans]|uniref:hypothetical protein n=1 Tax=Mariprofundus ferrooxydans TaxID=314344 RepID=UPI0012DF3466|nr:hypothetical protein [Mariprofundus ferrooxydans]
MAMMIGISSAYAATDPATALSGGMTESQLLGTLVSEGMSVDDATLAILNAGGNRVNTLAAAYSRGATESDLLNVMQNANVPLQDAVQAIIDAGGNQQNTLTAAMVVNPDFQYTPPADPTAGLSPTAAGPEAGPGTPGPTTGSISTTTGGGGGASPA